jgi:gluconate 5-dehydrogenase
MIDLFSLKGKVALITGSTRGLGHSMAWGLANAGAHVVINGRDPVVAKSKAEELLRRGLAASAEGFDTSDGDSAAEAVSNIVRRLGRLDILINNAGIAFRAALADTADGDWDKIIATNLTACFRLSRLAAQQMRSRQSGRIIMISSIMSLIGRPTVSAYAAAKGGLTSLTRTLAAELGHQGITCNAIAPGYFATDLVESIKSDSQFDAYIRSRTPLGRWGRADELAGPAVFLSSEAASYVNGHILIVDGGMTAVL